MAQVDALASSRIGPARRGEHIAGVRSTVPARQRKAVDQAAEIDGTKAFTPTHERPPSIAARLIEDLRPDFNRKLNHSPLRIRESLARLGQAIGRLEAGDDQLLQTADHILSEEQLRVELLRERLQMILKG